ncbi:class II fructose-bisphosphate aldolase [Candidatus Woesearchaeota archaeon]|nr:class II fructose-bisphosphate aldolase [Candidatus Woesearchaeota archaeon]
MAIVTTKRILKDAQRSGYAVGHFNTSNLEITKAIIEAASEMNSPVILATSKGAINYAGMQQISNIVRTFANNAKIPVALHLDHSPDLKLVKQCIANNWTSVMIDASHYSFAKNIELTKKVVLFARKSGVPVEAELGQLKGKEGWVKGKKIFTDPEQAKVFVEKTDCDSLAVSIGTSHGAYKFKGTPKLDINRLKEINNFVKIPLVLHGASSVPQMLVRKANKYGAKLKGVQGVPDSQTRQAIKNGICKVNTDTDIRIAFDLGIRKYLKQHPEDIDYREILGSAMKEVKTLVKNKIELFGSENAG